MSITSPAWKVLHAPDLDAASTVVSKAARSPEAAIRRIQSIASRVLQPTAGTATVICRCADAGAARPAQATAPQKAARQKAAASFLAAGILTSAMALTLARLNFA